MIQFLMIFLAIVLGGIIIGIASWWVADRLGWSPHVGYLIGFILGLFWGNFVFRMQNIFM